MKPLTTADQIVKAFISYLEENRQLDLLPEIAQKITEQSWTRTDPNLAVVFSKIELSANQKQQIKSILSTELNRPIYLKTKIDPSIIAGLKIEVAGKSIDGTLNRFLKDLENKVIYG